MVALRILRPANVCSNVLTAALKAPACKPQTPFTSTIFKATISLTTKQPLRTQSPSPTAALRTQRLQRTYASASPAQTVQSQNTAHTAPPSDLLSWDRFLGLRRRRRFFSTGVSVVTAIAAAVLGSPLIGEFDLDSAISKAAGIDPLIVIALGSLAVGGCGWFGGRILGSMLFSGWLRQKGWSRGFAEKEKSFFDRVKRYRADPSSSSPQNPIPDYYAERVSSVKDYRRWLKDQRTFMKKMYRGSR